jgi:hypothetical protein
MYSIQVLLCSVRAAAPWYLHMQTPASSGEPGLAQYVDFFIYCNSPSAGNAGGQYELDLNPSSLGPGESAKGEELTQLMPAPDAGVSTTGCVGKWCLSHGGDLVHTLPAWTPATPAYAVLCLCMPDNISF